MLVVMRAAVSKMAWPVWYIQFDNFMLYLSIGNLFDFFKPGKTVTEVFHGAFPKSEIFGKH